MSLSGAPKVTSGSRRAAWKGTDRYEILGVIGEGGMGVVYEANDRERRQRVALKTLQNFSPDALYLFKQEFRTLADVRHRNLVRLNELAMDGDQVFFTMELVLGTDFRSYLWSKVVAPGGSSSDRRTRRREPTDRGPGTTLPSAAKTETFADLVRLRPTLCQLIEGVQALHTAGKLHRDIKPSNVLVAIDSRVVIVDFGVATELSVAAQQDDTDPIVGTARYMAPEQAEGQPLSTATDWYSVGVMLYEALTGRAPFEGASMDVITRKCALDAPPPSSCATGVPDDLDALCCELLRREPDKRPSGPEILRRLTVGSGISPVISLFPRAEAEAVFVGREAQMGALHNAFQAARAGRAVTVRVTGAAGMGKSTLVQQFVDDLASRGDAMVLRGRAYERESVPYKAVDSVIDALSRHLMRLEDAGDASALPDDVWALARLFPVLRRVPSVAGSVAPPVIDPQGIRLRAFAALRALLVTLRLNKPVVVYIDDVQWGDTDSAGLLMELMRTHEAPPILLVMTHRQVDDGSSPFLMEITKHWPEGADVREVRVGPLEPDAAHRLALRLLESSGELAERMARAMAREGGGSPFLIEELARNRGHAADDDTRTLSVPTLQQMVAERLKRLPDDPRRMLELLAVGGRPLPLPVLADASGVYAAADELVAMLSARRFVRTGLRGGQDVVEIIHDRIRETIAAALPEPRLREHHGRLARVLQTTPGADAEAVAMHLLGAGDTQQSCRFAERAAEDAADKLAFEQAGRLFRLILQNVPPTSADARRVRGRLAQVLEWSGHGAEAARVYLEAAEGAKGMQRVELERAAAEQLLTCGRLDEGRAVLRRVLAAAGMTAPRTPIAAALWVLLYRLRMALFGLRFRDRDPEEVRREDRMRIDALYAVSIGFAIVDVVLGACVQARHLFLALRVGDSLQAARAAITMTTQLANRGGPLGRQEHALLDIVRQALERANSAEAYAYAEGNRGVALFLRGHWKESAEASDAAYARYPNIRGGWHSNAKLFAAYALAYTGDVPELTRRYKLLLAEAMRNGDLYTAVNLRTTTAKVVHLAADDPERARRDVRDAVAQWSKHGYLVQHWQALRSEVDVDLYVGEGSSAYERMQRDARALRRSFLLQSQFVRVMTFDLRGRAAIASIEQSPSLRIARLAEARRIVRRLERERMPYADALAALLAGAVAHAADDRTGAIAALRTAVDRLDAVHMGHFAASARYRLGLLLGDGGRALVREAEEAMTARGVRDINRFSSVYLPGRWKQ